MLYRRRVCLVSSCLVLAILTACGGDTPTRVEARAPDTTAPLTSTTIISTTNSEIQMTTTTTIYPPDLDVWLTGVAAWAWIDQVVANERAGVRPVRTHAANPPTPAPPSGPGQCGEPYPPCKARQRESGGNYRAVNPNGMYRGAWQFSQSTWNGTAQRAGRPDLVGVLPDQASVADQDEMARVLWDSGRGCAHWSGPSGNEC